MQNNESTVGDTRTRIVQQIIARQLTLSDILETSPQAWQALCARQSGRPFAAEEHANTDAWADFRQTFTPEQLERWIDLCDEQSRLHNVELHAAFALGRDCGTAASASRPAIERFIEAAHAVDGIPARPHDEPQRILRQGIQDIRRALPVAQQILLTGNVLDSVSDALDAYILARQAEAETARRAEDTIDPALMTERDAVYFVAITLGLLLAEAL